MALTRTFEDPVRKRVACDPACGATVLREGIAAIFAGDLPHRQGDPARLHQGEELSLSERKFLAGEDDFP
jgi:hypothetical protein